MAGGKRDEQAHPSNESDRPSNRNDRVQEEKTDHINVEMSNIGEEQALQHPSPNGNARGQEEDPDNMQNCSYSKMRNYFVVYRGYIVTAAVAVASTAVVSFIVYWLCKSTLNPDDCKQLLAASEHGKRPCPTDWIWHEMKCFYFSDKEESWFASRDFCSFYNASLAVFEKEKMYFVQRYKGSAPHWFGLRREPKQPWKWVNGNASTWEVLGDGGDCAFLNDEGRASSSRCLNLHHWICSKPDEFTRPKIV